MPRKKRLVMTRVLGHSQDGEAVAVAVAPINSYRDHEDWAAYVGVAPAVDVPDRRPTDPLADSLELIARYGTKLRKEAAVAIFNYHADTYRE